MRFRSLVIAALAGPLSAAAAPLPTAFTYQGHLTEAGAAASAAYDFEFCLFGSAGGADLLACHAPLESVAVTQGVFAVRLDFGAAAFAGDERFLEIRVRPDASTAGFTVLAPRQVISANPYALHALSVDDDAIGSVQIANGTILGADLVPGAVGTSQLANAAVSLAKLAANSVDSSKIVDGSIAPADIAAGAVGLAQIDPAQVQARIGGACGSGQFLQGVNADGSVACGLLPVTHVNALNTTVAAPKASDPDVAIGADGLPVVCFVAFDAAETQAQLHVAKCNDDACSGGDETVSAVDTSSPLNGVGCHIAIGADGFPTIAYQGFDNPPTARFLRVARCNDAACSGGNETLSTVDGPPASTFNAEELDMVIGGDGNPVIAYRENSLGGALKLARCNDPACSGGNETLRVLDDHASDSLGFAPALMLGADGFPTIAHGNATTQSLRVFDCDDAACSGGGESTGTVFAAVGGSPISGFAIALGSDGFPILSLLDSNDARVKAIKCNDPACSGNDEAVSTVFTGDGGAIAATLDSAIAVAPDGAPVVVFDGPFAAAVRSAKCNDAACSGGNETVSVLDVPPDELGFPLNMTLDTGGLPVVVYPDRQTLKLKVVRCGTRSCL
jgi:hypothetical protein